MIFRLQNQDKNSHRHEKKICWVYLPRDLRNPVRNTCGNKKSHF